MRCRICNSTNISLLKKNYCGYVEGSFYDIYKCNECNTNFIAEKVDKKIYDIIYKNPEIPGYDRYFQYANNIKNEKKPLLFLAKSESTYYPVYQLVSNCRNIRILEVGCGYGYLTYSLKQMGNDITGIDIAQDAISFAKNNFGNYFVKKDLKDFSQAYNKKFDLIIATEVIEHLENPVEFIRGCIPLLTEDGKILLTTPNKDYARTNAIWQTDLPPVHITWLSKKSFKKIADILNLKVTFSSFSNYYPENNNRLIQYLISRKERSQSHIIANDGKILRKNLKPLKLKSVLKYLLISLKLPRLISNFLYNKSIEKDITLGVILEK